MALHLIDLQEAVNDNISCPCCQQCVLDWSQTQYLQPCVHTTFIAIDLGFEYVSDDFEKTLTVSVDDIHDQSLNVWQSIQEASWPDLTVYQLSLGVADYKRYVGFDYAYSV